MSKVKLQNGIRILPGPLSGVRVLDLSYVISGPFCCGILADQGCDVIKIEGPTKYDQTRQLGPTPPRKRPGDVPPQFNLGAMYTTVNRGKRAITLDLNNEKGLNIFKKLCVNSDVVVQNFRPGVAKRLGIHYNDLIQINPKIIVLSISGFGQDGPYKKAKVFDQVIQAQAGIGEIAYGSNGEQSIFHNLIFDKVTSLNAAQAVAAALFSRERTGKGQHIELAMIDAAVHFLYPDAYWNQVWDKNEIKPFSLEWADIESKSVFETSDGRVTMQANIDGYTGILKVIENTELLEDIKTKSPGRELLTWFQTKSTYIRGEIKKIPKQVIFNRCLIHGVPCGIVKSLDEVKQDPQIKYNGTIETHVHEVHNIKYDTPKPPANFSHTPSKVQSSAPEMGFHNNEILSELGYTNVEIEELRSNGIIGK